MNLWQFIGSSAVILGASAIALLLYIKFIDDFMIEDKTADRCVDFVRKYLGGAFIENFVLITVLYNLICFVASFVLMINSRSNYFLFWVIAFVAVIGLSVIRMLFIVITQAMFPAKNRGEQ